MILADFLAEVIGGALAALVEAAGNVQWRTTTRLRPIRPLWLRLGRRLGLIRCSTCGQRFSAPACSLNRELGWSGHTVSGGIGAA